MLKTIHNRLFRANPKAVADEDLNKAQIELLTAQSAQEYWNSKVSMLEIRVDRLKEYGGLHPSDKRS